MSGQAEGVGLRERYVLGDRIAVGGMGAVFRAHDTERDEMVALKLMHEHLVQGASRWRFQREARVAASLWHPHIVRVRDHGRRIVDGMDQLYLVMDLIEGTTVRRMVRRKGVVPLGVFYALVCQLLDALAYVHARDVLHRDIKPSNLLVERGEDGALVLEVVDFGLATELGPDASRLTGGDQVLGTPAYMAPEQASGDELIGPAADLYAVGVLLFQALTGSPPFTGPAATVLVQKLRVSAPLERLPSTTPSALRELVAELLDRDPARRPRSAASVLERLRPHATTARLDIDTWNRLRPPAFQREDAATVVEQRRRHEPGHALTPAPEIWGREAERARFEQAAREVEEGEPRVVLVEGEVGLGKSELVQRVAVALRQASRFHVVRATDLDRGVVRAMRAAVEHTLRTTGRSRLAVERAVSALVRRTGPDDDDESAGALTELLRPSGLASGANRHQRNLATLSRFLRRLAREHPVLLVLEDAHEGGEDVGALLRHLLFDLWSDPYLLLCVITQRVEPKRGESPVSKTLRHLEATRPQALCRIDLRPLEDDVMLAGVGREYELD
ncbi:MAG: serine/threonine-protein kinase, partial [Polyangiaceae bacterium]